MCDAVGAGLAMNATRVCGGVDGGPSLGVEGGDMPAELYPSAGAAASN